MDLSEILHTDYSPSEDVHLEFSYGLGNFSLYCRLFSVFGLIRLYITRKTCTRVTQKIGRQRCCREQKVFLKINFNTWKDSKSDILSTSDVSINLVE